MSRHNYLVLITTSGLGKRLGSLTKNTNKALIKVGDIAVLSHIISLYPKSTLFYITVGHFGNLIKEYMSVAHKNIHVTYIEIKKYKGVGSSLAYSLLQAKLFLKKPFIFHACDTLIETTPPMPDSNWIGTAHAKNNTMYTSWETKENTLKRLAKGSKHSGAFHIGLVGIYDVAQFFTSLKEVYSKRKKDRELSDVDAIEHMIGQKCTFTLHHVKKWLDTGNILSLTRTQLLYQPSYIDIEKENEKVYFINGKVIKWINDETIVKNKVKRARILKPLVPLITDNTNHFYSYNFVSGKPLIGEISPQITTQLLIWASKRLWTHKSARGDSKAFHKACRTFYISKTNKRISQFLSKYNIKDIQETINNNTVPPIKLLIHEAQSQILQSAKQYRIHGDFILDNILYHDNNFTLIDWRQDFGGLLESGDIYYDLAKLQHSFMVNSHIVNARHYQFSRSHNMITVKLKKYPILTNSHQAFKRFVAKTGFDQKVIDLLTSMIWINMSPLHSENLGWFLYYYGRHTLNNILHNETNTKK